MLKKIFWFLVMIFVLYVILIFTMPSFADRFGNEKFNIFIRDFKNTIDEIYTNLPTKEEWQNLWNQTLSGAENLKNNVIDWANSLKDWVDEVRKNLSWAVDKYEEVKNDVDEAKKSLQDWVDKVKDITDTINSVFSWSVQETWSLLESEDIVDDEL